MAYRFHCGFDQVSTIAELYALLQKVSGATLSDEGGDSISGGAGRFGGNALSQGQILFIFPDNQQTWIVGEAIKIGSFPSSPKTILNFLDGTTYQTTIAVTTDRKLRAYRDHPDLGGTLLGETTFQLTANVWYYLEVKVKIDNTTGSVAIKVGQDVKLSLSNVDTQNNSNAYANRLRTAIGVTVTSDDMYVLDGSGSSLNDFQGESRMCLIVPNASGNYTQWTVSGATNNWQAVDETGPNGDTDYNSTSTTGNKDTFGFTNLPTTGTVVNIFTALYARRDDAGPREIREKCRSGGSDFNGATQAIQSTYDYYVEVRPTDPNTSAAWSQSNLEAAEFGYELVT